MAYQKRSKINLGGRIQQQMETKDDKGGEAGQRVAYYNNTSSLKFFSFKKSDEEIKQYFNILPWKRSNGEDDYVLDTWVHKNVGPAGGDYVCPKQNFGKPCPICEEFDRLRNTDWDTAKKCQARRRSMYLVQPVDDKGKGADEPQIFETSQFKFTDPLLTAAKSCAKIGQPCVDFVDPDEGKLVAVTTKKGSFGGREFMEPSRIDFDDRVEPISEKVFDTAYGTALDTFLIVKTYDQLAAIMMGAADEDAQESQESSEGDDTADKEMTDSEFIEYYEHATRTTEEEDERYSRIMDDIAEKARKKSYGEEEPAAEPEPEPEKEQKKAEPEGESCPNGFVFGADCEKKRACSSCDDETYSRCLRCKRNCGK